MNASMEVSGVRGGLCVVIEQVEVAGNGALSIRNSRPLTGLDNGLLGSPYFSLPLFTVIG
jgi:hypothetical protein